MYRFNLEVSRFRIQSLRKAQMRWNALECVNHARGSKKCKFEKKNLRLIHHNENECIIT